MRKYPLTGRVPQLGCLLNSTFLDLTRCQTSYSPLETWPDVMKLIVEVSNRVRISPRHTFVDRVVFGSSCSREDVVSLASGLLIEEFANGNFQVGDSHGCKSGEGDCDSTGFKIST